jgi:YD repeat-containing protein
VDYGGTLNFFVVMNIKNGQYVTLSAPDPYYASYSPVWSPDDHWFLITLLERYVTSGTLPFTNDRGDVYLVNSQTGISYRLTYTPADYELGVHWTEDGRVAFTVVTVQEVALTLQQAMNVEVVPSDEIVEPEPVNPDDIFNARRDVTISPDPNLEAWVTQSQQGDNQYQLNFGIPDAWGRTVIFSVPIPEGYQYSNILFGWRPSDYSYPQG